MHRIIYVSHAAISFELHQLDWLLTQARTFNAAHEITGILLYSNEQFLQVLEGDEATLRALYARICQDSRHWGVTTHADRPIGRRVFTDWQMAFQMIPPQQFLRLAGHLMPDEADPSQPELSAADHELLQLLRAFLFLKDR